MASVRSVMSCTCYRVFNACNNGPFSLLPAINVVGRYLSTSAAVSSQGTFYAKDLSITHRPAHLLKTKPPVSDLTFGKHFTDHMLKISWTEQGGWERPSIEPFRNLSLHPGSKVLHYAVGLFEGTKCYR